MPQRFEISFRTPRPDPAGQPTLPRPTSRIKTFLQAFAALLVLSAIVTVGIAIGSAVAVLIAALVAIALAALLIRGALYHLKSPDRS
jgi:hypothetical protein